MSSARAILALAAALAAGSRHATGAAAVEPLPARFSQGFARALAGESIAYPWAYPGRVPTLLSRATDGRMAVEWEGDAVPPGAPDGPVTYLWHAGLNSGRSGGHRFRLSVNGQPPLTFMTSPTAADREWTVRGEHGEALSFATARVTVFDERFGFMWLTAPRAYFGSGPPRFRVVGEAAGSLDYYLGPRSRVEAWTRATVEAATLADGRGILRVEISHLGEKLPAEVTVDGASFWTGDVGLGYLRLELPFADRGAGRIAVAVTIGGRSNPASVLPVARPPARALHLLPHSHVDVGYSDPQPEVERKQWQNLRDAVALGRRTASLPPEARFRWNVEGLWYVESYLKQADDAERAAFLAAVRDGTIGLQANTTGILTGLCTPEELRRWTDGARRLGAAYGLPPIRSVMQSDVPGLAWTAVSALANAGVQYVSSGPNFNPGLPGGGDRIGGTLDALGDRPFWWVSPSGADRVLFWMAGRGYSAFHGVNAGAGAGETEVLLLDYTRKLSERGYPWDIVQVRYTIAGDNGPVDPDLSEFVRRWNSRYATPRLVIDTTESLFAEMEARHGAELPVMAGDMTPYWEDGAVSTAAEEASGRASARRLAQAETVWALRDPAAFPEAAAAAAWNDQVMWHEHTWGARESVTEPDRPDVVAQWEFKRRFADSADRRSRELLAGAAPPSGSAVEVVNTASWSRSGLVLLPAELSRSGDAVRVVEGESLPSQRLFDGTLAVWLDRVRALGSAVVAVGEGTPAAPARPVVADRLAGDSGGVGIAFDAASGSISGLYSSAAPGRNLAAAGGLMRYLYVRGLDPAAAVSNGTATITLVDAGPLVATWRIDSDAPGGRHLTRTVRLVAGSPEVGIDVELDKLAVRDKESAHLAFPFALPGGVVRVDEGEALLEPGRNQLPGACVDFACAHGAADVSRAEVGVSLATLDTPLLELGALTDERLGETGARAWRTEPAPGTALYAYLLNNYWGTNYKADQEGRLSYRFVLRPHGAFDPVALHRLGEEHARPLLVFPVDPEAPPLRASFDLGSDTTAVVSALRPVDGGRALLLRLYNPSPEPTEATILVGYGRPRLFVSSAGGETGPALPAVMPAIVLPAWGVRILKLAPSP